MDTFGSQKERLLTTLICTEMTNRASAAIDWNPQEVFWVFRNALMHVNICDSEV